MRGQVIVFVIGMTLVCLAVGGLAVDATRAFLLRRTLQKTADAAAAAGAAQIDAALYYSTGGREVKLDPERARTQAYRWIAGKGLAMSASVDAAAETVHVVLRSRLPTGMLQLVGIDSIPVAAEARAEPVTGAP